jgi:hypothetical protein
MENFNLVKVEWSSYRDKIKPKIDKIGLRADYHELFTYIDKACSDEQAFLFLANDGFIVLRPRIRQKIPYIEISLAYCDGGNAIARYQSSVIELAKKGDAEYLQFTTVRKGYKRALSGWTNQGKYKQFFTWRMSIKES